MRYVAVLLMVLASLATACQASLAQEAGEVKPNILFIMTDDQPESTFTPEVMPATFERVVGRGMLFENGAVTTSLCCPMRASTLRGQYAHNTGVLDNEPPSGGFQTFKARGYGADNLGVWMQQAGYRTGFFGKVMNGYSGRYRPKGWNSWYGFQGGYVNRRKPMEVNVNGRIKHPKTDSAVYFTSRAEAFVRQEDDRPWMAFVPTNAPHTPYLVPKSYARKQGLPTALPTPESFNEADVSDKAPEARRKRLGGRGVKHERRSHAKRVKATYAVDQIVVKRLVDALEDTGQLDNTYVIFMSDNGMMEGRHRMSAKAEPYEEAHQVPFAVVGPGVEQDTSGTLAANIDLAPTFLDVAGAAPKEHFDGESLLPTLTGEGELERDYLLYEGWAVVKYGAVRTEDGQVFIHYDKSGAQELYDLGADPYQLENVYGQNPELEADLAQRLDALRVCEGDSCRQAEAG